MHTNRIFASPGLAQALEAASHFFQHIGRSGLLAPEQKPTVSQENKVDCAVLTMRWLLKVFPLYPSQAQS
jgi:hypothetical protein